MLYQQTQQKLIIVIGAEKEFDKTESGFMAKTLSQLGLDMDNIHEYPKANIIFN